MTSDGKGWTLIARFSNNDNKNWMNDTGYWWYDQQTAMGAKFSPSINDDMISPAFWLVSGREFKITRSDDSNHTPLLETTGNYFALDQVYNKCFKVIRDISGKNYFICRKFETLNNYT